MTSIDRGMTVAEVQALGHKLQDSFAADIRRFVTDIEKLVGGTSGTWIGQDANNFRSWWPAKRAKLSAIADDLHGYGQSALNNAQEQTNASGENIATGVGAVGLVAAGAGAGAVAAAGGAAGSPTAGVTAAPSGSTASIQNFQAHALDRSNWNGTTPAGNPGIDSDGSYGAQCADLGIEWSKQIGHGVGFDGLDSSSSIKPGWHYVPGGFGDAQPGDVITCVGGRQHVVVVVGSPSGGTTSVLQQNPGSPAVASYSTSTSGVIWRPN